MKIRVRQQSVLAADLSPRQGVSLQARSQSLHQEGVLLTGQKPREIRTETRPHSVRGPMNRTDKVRVSAYVKVYEINRRWYLCACMRVEGHACSHASQKVRRFLCRRRVSTPTARVSSIAPKAGRKATRGMYKYTTRPLQVTVGLETSRANRSRKTKRIQQRKTGSMRATNGEREALVGPYWRTAIFPFPFPFPFPLPFHSFVFLFLPSFSARQRKLALQQHINKPTYSLTSSANAIAWFGFVMARILGIIPR